MTNLYTATPAAAGDARGRRTAIWWLLPDASIAMTSVRIFPLPSQQGVIP
jgi:hypothetical protein